MENVLLIFGGKSYEHDISIVTASQIFLNTKINNINLVPVYLSKNDKMYCYKNMSFNLNDFKDFSDEKPNKMFKELLLVFGENEKLFVKTFFGLKQYISANLAIIACHGGDGENGKLVAMLEKFGIYCSAGSVSGLGICMDKFLFKKTMQGLNVPVVRGFKVCKNEFDNCKNQVIAKIKRQKFPVVIKPCFGGSSIGLFVAKCVDELDDKLKMVFEFDSEIIVEKFISNAREFNVAVMGDELNCEVSEIDEPLKINDILSFEDKYLSGSKSKKVDKNLNSMASQKRKFPAELPEDLTQKIKLIALKVFKNLNLSGVARIDFLFDQENNKIYVCEVNAVPGSLSYYFFSNGHILLNEFTSKLIEIAKNKSFKSNVKIDYITKIL